MQCKVQVDYTAWPEVVTATGSDYLTCIAIAFIVVRRNSEVAEVISNINKKRDCLHS